MKEFKGIRKKSLTFEVYETMLFLTIIGDDGEVMTIGLDKDTACVFVKQLKKAIKHYEKT